MGAYSSAKFWNEVLDAIIYAGVVVFMVIRPFFVQTFLIPSESMVHTLEINDFIIANKGVYRYTEPQRGDIIVFRPPAEALDKGQTDVDFIKRLIGKPGDLIEVKDEKYYRNGHELQENYKFLDPERPPCMDWKLVFYDGPYQPWKGKYIPVSYSKENQTANYFQPYAATSKEYSIGWLPDPDGKSYAMSWKNDLEPDELEREQYLLKAPAAKIPPGYYLMMGDNRRGSYDGRGWGLVPRENIVGRSEVIWWPPSRWGKTRAVRVGEDAGH